jgi:hypothetical protein
MAEFRTPNGAAYCGRDEYTGNRLVCWTPNDGFTVRMTARGTARQRYLRANRGFHDRYYGRTLRFGRSVRLGAFMCRNRRSGLTCTNRRRHGWWLGRYVGYRLFSVPPAIAAASITTCWDRSFEDLKAKNIRCDTAERVYRKSRRVAQQDPDLDVTRFKFVGLRWTCRASNPPAVPFYTWRCRATRSRLMQYRWKSGD